MIKVFVATVLTCAAVVMVLGTVIVGYLLLVAIAAVQQCYVHAGRC